MKPPRKPHRPWHGAEHIAGGACGQRRAGKHLSPFLSFLTLCISSIWLFICNFYNILCDKWVNFVKCFHEFCELLQKIHQALERGHGNSWFIAGPSEVQATIWGFQSDIWSGGSFKGPSSPVWALWDGSYLQAESIRTEFRQRTPDLEYWLCMGRDSTHFGDQR